ncbi:MAG: hypothetical protein V2A79_14785 [Planctomycetota bacterium]
MADWCDGYLNRIGKPLPRSIKGRAAGTLKRLFKDMGEPDLTEAVRAWWAKDRPKFGAALFEQAIADGAADLVGRDDTPPFRAPTIADLRVAIPGRTEEQWREAYPPDKHPEMWAGEEGVASGLASHPS